jgi:hypothetical protein
LIEKKYNVCKYTNKEKIKKCSEEIEIEREKKKRISLLLIW